MMGKTFRRASAAVDVQTKGFDDYDLRLGDIMRGERATLGKSLLDIQRELKIKAAYIAAIENADPSAFDTPGFIAGYVRSYARYLGMDPDEAFASFCKESGFVTAHGMSEQASSLKNRVADTSRAPAGKDIFLSSRTPFIPARESLFAQMELRAIGSFVVLATLIAGLGYGGWTVLQEVQRVQFAPVEQAPVVVSDLDPLAGGANRVTMGDALANVTLPSPDALDRLYRPQALDVPVMVARDTPIATLTPRMIGALVPEPQAPDSAFVLADMAGDLPEALPTPSIQVVEPPVPQVQLVAARPAWVRVQAADGVVLFEGIMEPGQNFVLPATEEPATLRVGESGAMYFAVNGQHYGPVGDRGVVTSNVVLSADSLTSRYALADPARDADLAEIIRVAMAVTDQ
ncbi:helix-turn-helix domain-containing protein [Yoonia vestfoldensis]|jgi:cytoskeletal protein RodZ|uniref:Cytoskeletal protein RodZ n=1 Tax=Yoonia vestfoldensis TaxID=245188 RepID=A0A1Y0EAY1_9RHOB|nr:helix-turn-helix domain-containing protein [Yoonia vestfoldensis]ARU00512.1 cytoskeletal protein RodZ [Yoonia vestfoldensis]